MGIVLSKIYDQFLIAYVFFWTSLGYTIPLKKETESFIVTDNGIEILNLSTEIDKENLINYLNHHIIHTNDKFHPMYFFDKPLVIRFKYQNEIYRMCISQMESKNTDHSVSVKDPKILSAVVKTHECDEGKCVTEQLVEFHGPERNFFRHIPDTISDFSVLLKNKGELHIFDMMGNKNIHKL